jgi:AhpD family alkylhydroperoxidase
VHLPEPARAKVELLGRERAPLLAQPYYEGGNPGPIAAALANVPELMEPMLSFTGAVFGPTSVDPRSKEIVILRVSAANGCRYCTETHTRMARRLGFSAEELSALRGEGPPPARWSQRELALVAFSEALSEQASEAVDLLRPHFEDPQIVELVALGSATILLNRFATALELPP